LQGINLQVQAGQRIVLSGPNGCGKTTLLRTVMGSLPPLTGRVLLGSSVRIGIMSQDLSNLPPERTPVECVDTVLFVKPQEQNWGQKAYPS